LDLMGMLFDEELVVVVVDAVVAQIQVVLV
jgi:hypothetical protein